MSQPEICPARFTTTHDEWITESRLPSECRSCLYFALDSGTAIVTEIDSTAESVVAMWGIYPDFDPEAADRWESTLMKGPDASSTREVEIAHGFDLDTHSYIPTTETCVKSVFFDCES